MQIQFKLWSFLSTKIMHYKSTYSRHLHILNILTIFIVALYLAVPSRLCADGCDVCRPKCTLAPEPVNDLTSDFFDKYDEFGDVIPNSGYDSALAYSVEQTLSGDYFEVYGPTECSINTTSYWRVTLKPWAATLVSLDPNSCKTPQPPTAGTPGYSEGEPTSSMPMPDSLEAQCSTCSKTSDKPPYEYGIDIGAGYDPVSGVPIGRVRFKYDIDKDGELANGFQFRQFIWENFVSSEIINVDDWPDQIYAPDLNTSGNAYGAYIKFTKTKDTSNTKVIKVVIEIKPIDGASFRPSTITFELVQNKIIGGFTGNGVKVTHKPYLKDARVSYMLCNTLPADSSYHNWCSQDFDTDTIIGTDHIISGHREKIIEHTAPALRGGRHTVTTYSFVAGHNNMIESETVDAGATDGVRVTSYTYHPGDAPNPNNRNKLKTISRPDGSWEAFLEYDSKGKAIDTLMPFFEQPTTAAAGIDNPDSCVRQMVTADTSEAISYGIIQRSISVPLHTIKTNQTKINGLVTAETTSEVAVYTKSQFGAFPARHSSFMFDDNMVICDSSLSVDPSTGQRQGSWNLSGLVDSDSPPDHRFEASISTNGLFTYREYLPMASPKPYADGVIYYRETYRDATIGTSGLPSILATGPREVLEVWQDKSGRELARKTTVGGTLVDLVVTTYGSDGGKIVIRNATSSGNGFQILTETVSNVSGSQQSVVTTVDAQKTSTKQVYDYATNGLLSTEVKNASDSAFLAITTSDILDPATHTRTLTESVGSPVTLKRTSSTTLDSWDRPTASIAINGAQTSYAYTDQGRTTTETLNGGVTKITTQAIDGHLKSLSGTAQLSEYHSFDVVDLGGGVGAIRETIRFGSDSSSRFKTVLTDALGRVIQETRPAPPQADGAVTGSIVTTTSYSNTGRVAKISQTGGPTRLFDYFRDSATGAETVREAVDMPAAAGGQPNDTIDLTGADLVTDTITSYDTATADSPWKVTTVKVYGAGPADESRDTVTKVLLLVRDTEKKITTAPDGTVTTITSLTLTNSTQTASAIAGITPKIGDTVITEDRLVPSATTPTLVQKSIYRSGRLLGQITAPSTAAITMSYDGLGRILTRSGSGVYEAWSYDTPNSSSKITLDRIASYRKGSSTSHLTNYGYETDSSKVSYGLLKSVTTPAGVTYYAYGNRGQLTYQWGTADAPVAYGYNPATGEQVTMKTYQNGMAAWSSSTFPGIWNSAASSVTTWAYDQASGALTSKTDAAGHAVQYLYTPGGNLSRRISSRGITTDYSYDAAGKLIGTDYSDATPDVTLQYTRAGDVKQITDGSGTHTSTRSGTGYSSVSDAVTGAGAWAGLVFETTRSLPVTSGVGYRNEQFTVRQGGSALYQTERRQELNDRYVWSQGLGVKTKFTTDGNGRPTGFTTAADSNTTYPTYTEADTAKVISYDTLGRLHQINYGGVEAADAKAAKAAWTYTFDAAWRRTTVTPSTFASTINSWSYTYNTEGSVKTADRKNGTTTLPKQHWEYQYDAIGNRTSMIKGTTATATDVSQHMHTYSQPAATPHDGTQYGAVTHPSTVDITGYVVPPTTTNANAVMMKVNNQTAVNNTTTSNVGELGTYYREFSLSSAGSAAQWVSTSATIGTGASLNTSNGWLFYRGTNESFAYDADGNLSSDAHWTYTWDAENRLTSLTENATILRPTGAPARTRLEFGYDSHSRRTFKKAYRRNSADTAWELHSHLVFLYDGWNVVAELDALNSNRVLRRYVWGPDMSNTMAGAGGVGGLLFVEHCADVWTAASGTTYPSVRYLAQSDANGNVMGLMAIDGTTKQTIVCRFDYDAFGNRVTNTSPAGLEACPIGFSSKYEDKETNFVYYGFRYYSPEMGRWLSRDPIGERGGINLYGMCQNNAVNMIDLLGLIEYEIEAKKAIKHAVNNKATSGNLMRVMAAFTDGAPQWTTGISGGTSTDQINPPKNLIKADKTYKEIYVLLVTMSQRDWRNTNPGNGMIFPTSGGEGGKRNPYLKQVYKVKVDTATGKLTVTPEAGNVWSAQSERAQNRYGGALASQFDYYLTHNALQISDGAFGFTYTGSGGWDQDGIVDHQNAGPFNRLGQALTQTLTDPKTGQPLRSPIDDSHRNEDGSPISVGLTAESVCKKK